MTKLADYVTGLFSDSPHSSIDYGKLYVAVRFFTKQIVFIDTKQKYAQFNYSFNRPATHGPKLAALANYLQKEGYGTNLT